MPLISVLMPVYNRVRFVEKAVQSIQNQTIKDWELIILDDASTDGTLEICRRLAAEDPRISVYANTENLGVGTCRNLLLGYASGEYLANNDSDDISIPDRLEQQVKILRENPEVGLVAGLAAWIDDDGRVLGYEPTALLNNKQYPQNKTDLVRMLFMKCDVSNPTCMYRRSLNLNGSFGNYRVGEDWYFFLRVAHQALIWGIPRVLVEMRRGKNHLHLWKDYTSGLEVIRSLRRDLYQIYGPDPASPISYALYRRGMADTLTRIGRNKGGVKGILEILHALLYGPFYPYSWKSLLEFSGRGIKKVKHRIFRSPAHESAPV